MCGISGFWDIKRKNSSDKLYNIVHLMNEMILHRGPDEEGIYQNDNLCMGMRRLSIIDISGGSQPVYNEDKSLSVVYNGEIYNFNELRDELKNKGHFFATNADTEVIVHSFEEYGVDAFDRFDGMFAFALHDRKNDVLYLVRDRMGEKPLYYTANGDAVIFGSELKCLVSTGKIEKKINKRALNQYLQLTYIPAPLSIYEGVYKVLPGHYLKITSDGFVTDHEYWDIPVQKPSDISFEDASKKLRELLKTSVTNRMISDVPIGAFLSGGVDSASVVGLMTVSGSEKPKTFTIGSEENRYDERHRANEVVEMYGTNHHERTADFGSFLSILDNILEYMDEPFADSSEIPTYLVSQFTKEYVTVALTGDAGDELFAGYNKYLMSYYGERYLRLPSFLRKKIIPRFVKLMPAGSSAVRKIRKVIDNADKNPMERHRSLMHMGIKENDIDELLCDEYRDRGSLDFIASLYDKHPSSSDLQKSLYTDLKTVLEGDMLVKVDRMSMLNSLETRIPMLSKDIIEFSMTLPDSYKLKGKERKRVLKSAMKPLLPEGFEKYPKCGFEIPISKWMKEEMRHDVEEVLSLRNIKNQGIFDYRFIDKIKKEHFSDERDRGVELWVIYVFEKWLEKQGLSLEPLSEG